MANYLEQLYPALYTGIVNPDSAAKSVPVSPEQPKQYNNASSLLINFLNITVLNTTLTPADSIHIPLIWQEIFKNCS